MTLKLIRGEENASCARKSPRSTVHPFGTRKAAELLDLPEGCIRANPAEIIDAKLSRLEPKEERAVRLRAGISITHDSPLGSKAAHWTVDRGRSRVMLDRLERHLLEKLGRIEPKH